MIILKFIYYCFFKSFSLLKRKDIKNEDLALVSLAVMLTTNTFSIFIYIFKYFIPNGIQSFDYLKTILFTAFWIIFFIWIIFCYYKFAIAQKHKVLIYYFDNVFNKTKLIYNKFNILVITVSLIYFIGSTFLLLFTALFVNGFKLIT